MLLRFARALDDNDWELYRSCLADPVHADYEQVGVPRRTVPADEWVAFVRDAVEPQTTVHYFTNFLVTLDGDVAHVRHNHLSCHRVDTRLGSSTNRQFGAYDTALERTDRWRLTAIRHRVAWIDGNPALLAS